MSSTTTATTCIIFLHNNRYHQCNCPNHHRYHL
jgi:hypothetical protein